METSQKVFRSYRRIFMVILGIGLIAGLFFINEISFTNIRAETFRRPLPAPAKARAKVNQSPSNNVVDASNTSVLATPKPEIAVVDEEKKYVILMWTPVFGRLDWLYDDSVRDACPLLKNGSCEIISDKNQLNISDVVLFHWRDVDLKDLPITKDPNQKWVLINFEAPPSYLSKDIGSKLGTNIDWTASYRLDSDFYAPYGLFKPRNTNEKWDELKFDEFKSKKQVVCMVSNCKTSSNREQFVLHLQHQLGVDVFGRCGNSTKLCPHGISRIQCYNNFAKHYKFYLSFENSICVDYATEKFFLPLAAGMVPVVLGGANYSRIAPKMSYINVMDFESPEQLGKYLVEVGNNYTLYKSYLEWKQHSVVDFADLEDRKSRHWICDLCKRLFYENSARTKNVRDINKWWFDEGQCAYNPQWQKIQRYTPKT